MFAVSPVMVIITNLAVTGANVFTTTPLTSRRGHNSSPRQTVRRRLNIVSVRSRIDVIEVSGNLINYCLIPQVKHQPLRKTKTGIGSPIVVRRWGSVNRLARIIS